MISSGGYSCREDAVPFMWFSARANSSTTKRSHDAGSSRNGLPQSNTRKQQRPFRTHRQVKHAQSLLECIFTLNMLSTAALSGTMHCAYVKEFMCVVSTKQDGNSGSYNGPSLRQQLTSNIAMQEFLAAGQSENSTQVLSGSVMISTSPGGHSRLSKNTGNSSCPRPRCAR